MTHSKTDFLKYRTTPFEPFILPIIPAGATLKEDSKLTPDQLGKIPGKFYAGLKAWSGFYAWQASRAKHFDLTRWQGWQDKDQADTAIALALRTGEILAIDIDITDEVIAEYVTCLIIAMMGMPGAIRRRPGTGRRMLFYGHKPHTAPVSKSRIAFDILATGEKAAVEVLGYGQQVVAEGPHAKGALHYWQDGIGLIEGYQTMAENLQTIESIDQMMVQLRNYIDGDERYERTKFAAPSMREAVDAIKIDNLMSPHIAKDQELLARAIRAINLDHPSMDYDRWIDVMRAICAACAGSLEFFDDVVWPWICTQTVTHGQGPTTRERGIEWLQERWNSFHDSTFGAEFVYGVAAEFGFREGWDSVQLSVFDGIPLPIPVADAAGVGDGSAAGASPNVGGAGSSGASGSGGPIPPNDTHIRIAQSFAAQYSNEWKWSADACRWYRYTPERGIWKRDDTLINHLGLYMSSMAQQILATVAGPTGVQRARALESTGTIKAVEALLKSTPAMLVRERDFDAQPHLLNTPDHVWDLKNATILSHSPDLLMRMCTAVSPDLTAILAEDDLENPAAIEAHFAKWAPRFLFTVKNLDGSKKADVGYRDWFVLTVGAMYGYIQIGEILHAGIFFMEGEPGLGKTQIWYVMFLLLDGESETGYAKKLTADFISKNGVAHRFDMSMIIGKRMLFIDETMMGISFDEARMSDLGSGAYMEAEVKFGRDSVGFTNRGKLCISGNHRPHFISGAAGGLASRMMLVEAFGEDLRGKEGVDKHNIAVDIVQEEGPALLMWAIQNAIQDYKKGGHERFHRLMAPTKAATRQYVKEDNTFVQWVEDRMQLSSEIDIDLLTAFAAFREYQKDINDKQTYRRTDFKRLLKAAFPHLKFETRSENEGHGRACIRGLGYKRPEGENVVVFPSIGNKDTEVSKPNPTVH